LFRLPRREEKIRGGLRLTSSEGLRRGGDLGPSIDDAQLDKSLLLRMISYEDDDHQMPPKAKLSPGEIEVLRQWVLEGATYDPALEIAGTPSTAHRGFAITEESRQHWAYRPVTPLDQPTDIDSILSARLEKAGLKMNGPAPAEQLVRRLHLQPHRTSAHAR